MPDPWTEATRAGLDACDALDTWIREADELAARLLVENLEAARRFWFAVLQ